MPRGDRTGPYGFGPMTGRGAGYCAGYNIPGFANPLPVKRFAGRGGRGHRNWYYATGLAGWQRAPMGLPTWGGFVSPSPSSFEISKEKELEMLKKQAEYFEECLGDIKKRIKELKEEKED
ncbi:MAG: DUF5320 domain-containing protein [Clostridia bacterium]|nr:DUF5320 domain-containing protein [Clostridia bacterium]